MPKITFIDHYDSFSHNVLDWLWRGGISPIDIQHVFYDEIAKIDFLRNNPNPTILGPGPHSPKDVPSSCHLAQNLVGRVPVFGLCLGHQILGFNSGAKIMRAKDPWHGHPVRILNSHGSGIFQDCPDNFTVASYNSLTVQFPTSQSSWRVTATNEHNEVMAMEYLKSDVPTWATQFHPESFMTEFGEKILQNWLKQI